MPSVWPKGKLVDLPLCDLIQERSLQMRAEGTSPGHVVDLAEVLRSKKRLPRIQVRPVVVKEGREPTLYVVDGFHTCDAHLQAGKTLKVPCNVLAVGTWFDAVCDAAKANIHPTAPLKRTHQDKRRAVESLIDALGEEGEVWSARKIASHIGVGTDLVIKIQKEKQSSGVSLTTPQKAKPEKSKESEAPTTEEVTEKSPERTVYCLTCGASGPDCACRADRREISSPPKPAPAPQLDGWGIPIQPHALEAFEDVSKFEELFSILRDAQKKFNDLANSPGGKFLQLPEVSSFRKGTKNGEETERWVHAGIDQAIRHLRDKVPTYTVCPYAYAEKDHGPQCPCCKDLNWTPALEESSIPKVCVARAKKALIPKEKQ